MQQIWSQPAAAAAVVAAADSDVDIGNDDVDDNDRYEDATVQLLRAVLPFGSSVRLHCAGTVKEPSLTQVPSNLAARNRVTSCFILP